MDNDKIILEIYGKVETLVNSTNRMESQLTDHVKEDSRQHNAMWKKIDVHSRIISYFLGAIAISGFAIRCWWFKIRTWFVG